MHMQLKKCAATKLQSYSAAPCKILQRKCTCGGAPGPTGEFAACREKKRQRRLGNEPATSSNVPPIVHEVLRSPGQPLDPATRAYMEPRFGRDFSRVRVHTDPAAAESARAVSSLAYTVGCDVIFGADRYAPRQKEGLWLIAHELTHTVQQEGGAHRQSDDLRVTDPEGPAEMEAHHIADIVTQGGAAATAFKQPSSIARVVLLPPAPRTYPPTAPGTGGPSVPAAPRTVNFVEIKRNNIHFSPRLGTDYGHFWTEIDGTESYGWWPDHCPVTLYETLFGTGGDLNGVAGCGGTSRTQDPHHGETADRAFHPVLTVPKTDATVRSDIRSFANAYSGGWRWTFGYGQNCRTFQASLMASVGLAEP
jgi:hypothetical protein